MNIDKLGGRIRKERQAKGITQEQLAEKVDISVNFMSLIENGRNMSVETLVKIANALGVTVDYLLSDIVNLHRNIITEQINQQLAALNNEEQLFFLNMIKQYKQLDKDN